MPRGVERAICGPTVCTQLIPAAAAEGLIDAIDIYVEDIAFDLEDLAAVANAADSSACRSDATPISSDPRARPKRR